ncbi:hypothetical protein GGC63_006994 [Paenibacillus sp. OAS669]|nr:hypothetical protein [Paenibacillus sp. OAS669]
MLQNNRYYIVYDELTITICSFLDDVCEELAAGGTIYGYADNEEIAQMMLVECFHYLSAKNA